MKINELLDATKDANGITSNGQLARILGVTKQAVSRYYLGERAPDEFACLQIANATGKPLQDVIAAVKAATEKDEKRREAWENYMKSLGGIAAAVFLTISGIVTGIMTSTTAEAAPLLNSQACLICIMLNLIAVSEWKSALRFVRQICTFGLFSPRVRQMAT